MTKKRTRRPKKRNPLAKLVRELFQPRIKPSAKRWKRRKKYEDKEYREGQS